MKKVHRATVIESCETPRSALTMVRNRGRKTERAAAPESVVGVTLEAILGTGLFGAL